MSDEIRENGIPSGEPGPGEGSQPQPPPPPPSQGPQWQAPPPPPPPPGAYYYKPPPPPPYAPVGMPPQRPRRWLLPAALAIGCLPWLILFVIVMTGIIGGIGAGDGFGGDHVRLIRVEGVITGGKSSEGLFGGGSAGSENLVSQLEKARRDKSCKAILIRINSPGGSAAGSEEVYDEIMRVRKKKPVYASMGDVAASGGYYIAAACDKIYADGATLTGSIGVIFETADMSTLFRKIGYSPEVVKSGKFKDIGSPNRPMTAEERQLLQGMIDDIYVRFVRSVSEGRKIPFDDVKKIADGRIFTGQQAQKLKLVDKIGGLRDATRAAGRAGGIDGEPRVKESRRSGIFGAAFEDGAASDRLADAATRRMVDELLRRSATPSVK